jgi:hypothetical protein
LTKRFDRKELLRAIQQGKLAAIDKSMLSEDDILLLELYARFPMADRQQLVDAPESVIKKAESIQSGEEESIASLAARLIFDSWAEPSLVGVRGSALVEERRVRFETGPYLLDLRAEKHTKGWHFIAEVSSSSVSSSGCKIVAGKQEIHENDAGLFEWSAAQPPRHLKLRTADDELIELPEISWRKIPNK